MDPNNNQSNPLPAPSLDGTGPADAKLDLAGGPPSPLPDQPNPANPFAPVPSAQPLPSNASLSPQSSVSLSGVEPAGLQSTQDTAIVSPQTTQSEPVPTFIPPATPLDSTTQTLEVNPEAPLGQIPNTPVLDGTAPLPSTPEPVPTDLSQLVSSDNTANSLSASPIPVTTPETLVSASSGGSETAQVVTNGSHKPPKWLLIAIGGGVLVLALGGAVAYFVLGVGNSGTLPTSVPAEQTQRSNTSLSNSPSALIPTSPPTLPSQEQTGASSPSATFGNLDGSAISPTPATQSGTSAAELLRQRQAASPQ